MTCVSVYVCKGDFQSDVTYYSYREGGNTYALRSEYKIE